MKKRLALGLLVLVCLGQFFFLTRWHVHAPELFGDGILYRWRVGGYAVGYVQAWGGWLYYAKGNDCRLVQLHGEVITGVTGGGVNCKQVSNKPDSNFRGWIDFRGHPRKFCGAVLLENMPRPCYGE